MLLHHLLPGTYVVHSHATIVNTLTCHAQGQPLAAEIFGDDILWLPYVDPGFILAQSLKSALADYASRTGRTMPKAILMANHGLIVAGNSADEIRANTDEGLHKIAARLGDDWQTMSFGQAEIVSDVDEQVRRIGPALRGLLAASEAGPLKVVTFDESEVAHAIVGTELGKAAAVAGPLTPDQIVYCGSYPLWFEPQDGEDEAALVGRLRSALHEHAERTRFLPKIVLVRGVGLFAAGDDFKQASTAPHVCPDAANVMAGATRLGGISYLTERERRFIEDWEVESYRRSVSMGAATSGGERLKGRVAVVTGAAQGFGLEIAQGMAGEGAHVVLADVNEAGVLAAAEALSRKRGAVRALGLTMDVTSGDSIRRAIDAGVRIYGGVGHIFV